MKLTERLSDRALALLTAGFFALLGLDIAVLDVVPFVDEAVLATIASGLAATMLSRRKARRLAREAEAAKVGTTEDAPA